MNPQDPSTSVFKAPTELHDFRSDISVKDSFSGFRFHKRPKRTAQTDIHNAGNQPLSPRSPEETRVVSLIKNQQQTTIPTTTFQRPVDPVRNTSLLLTHRPSTPNPLHNLFNAAKIEHDARSANQYPSPEREENFYSIASSESIDTSRTERITTELPKEDIVNYEYIQYIPANLTDVTKMQQLLFWLVKSEMNNDQLYNHYQQSNPIVEKAKKRLLKELSTSNTLVSWRKQPDVKRAPAIAPNPTNEANRKRLQLIQESMKELQKEIDDWETCSVKAVDLHVTTWQKIDTLEKSNFLQEYDDSWMTEIEPEQQTFVKNFLNQEPGRKISDVAATMEADVTQFRLVLGIANEFQKEAGELASTYNAKYAHKRREKARIVPVEADKQSAGLFKESEEERRINEFENMRDILRLFSRLAADANAATSPNQQENASTWSDMELEEEIQHRNTSMDINE